MTKYLITADIMYQGTFEIFASSELEARNKVEQDLEHEPLTVEPVTAPMVVDIKEVRE